MGNPIHHLRWSFLTGVPPNLRRTHRQSGTQELFSFGQVLNIIFQALDSLDRLEFLDFRVSFKASWSQAREEATSTLVYRCIQGICRSPDSRAPSGTSIAKKSTSGHPLEIHSKSLEIATDPRPGPACHRGRCGQGGARAPQEPRGGGEEGAATAVRDSDGMENGDFTAIFRWLDAGWVSRHDLMHDFQRD